ncbi:MAG: hydrolase family protein [Solirubrobacterales bacterium]|nr:hydrolase family protein [Solirubrobacterales bacterium]
MAIPGARDIREAARARRRSALPVLASVATVALWLALSSAASAAGIAAGASYAALGDSYTSAFGVMPLAPTAPPECGQSTLNYPHLTAAALRLSLTDVSCGGAKTENFTVAQYPDQPPQFDALSASTQVVSVGMGGNDNNLFISLLAGCTATDAGRPNIGAPCEKQYASFVNTTFEKDLPPREKALEEIHALSPKAKVFIVGYPEITPQNGYCPAAIPWTTGDLRWFRDAVTARGNALLERSARAHDDIFVDTFGPSRGHNACEPVGVRWIEPLIGSLTGVPVHPNATGEEHDAFDLERAMLRAGIR